MFPLASLCSSHSGYQRVDEEECETKHAPSRPRNKSYTIWQSFFIFVAFTISLLVLVLFVISSATEHKSPTLLSTQIHSKLWLRREWRSLSRGDKLKYIAAVQCLRTKTSKLGLNQTLYDDFPWVHSQVGEYSHDSAAFLAWHRRFLSVYENTLQTDCQYDGALPYWDWTNDWEDIAGAPVWHNTIGFGGPGDPTTHSTFANGYCVTTGPFANLEVLYIKNRRSSHCLSRSTFEFTDHQANYSAWIQPSSIFKVMSETHYLTFNLGLENTAHNSIPRLIEGDFSVFTAPYDPVFFLHHAQLDRIWFKWQHLSDEHFWQYEGRSARGSSVPASLQDKLPMGGLVPDVEVATVMDTKAKSLSYIYL